MSKPYAEVIGDPIAHSKSPLIHNFWLQKLGIDAEYRARHVRAGELADYIAQRRQDSGWRGCNVTIPHKVSALALSDHQDDVSQAIGATNCLVHNSHRALVATNTDADGFNAPLAGSPLAGRTAAVFGAGGAARAVLMMLKAREVAFVWLYARDPLRARDLLARFGLAGAALSFDAPLDRDVVLVVNCTPMGMLGEVPLEPDLGRLPDDAMVYDLVYAPRETSLLSAARARGLPTINGLAMLVAQAAIAFELFFGAPAPRAHDVELEALLTA